ncbi:ABC transporter substrate-binding protein [Bacillus sp. AGMB 02131]|uniref:ABC transporter substrate-binding protein n=2 Tax=Peribacillus faecalis TaxID=2772559 RepID=A0A927CXA0_9BACI|nr:ABC transporter substrate-binding protein [Peribacillus faecalis]
MLTLAGCGANEAANEKASSSSKTEEQQNTAISITDFTDRTITFDKVPSNIVSVGNGELDIIYALGGELVGRATTHNEELNTQFANVEQVGNTHEFDLEKIASLKPDVVLANNPLNMKDIASIEGIGSQIILTHANSVSDIQNQITLFGKMIQKQDKAKELVADIEQKVADIKAETVDSKTRVLLIYGAPGTYMAALPNSLSGNLLELAGGENIASDYPAIEKYPQYAQLNTERIVEANPEYIFLMTHADPSAVKEGFINEMAQNPAWNSIDAVKNERIEILPADLFGDNPGTKVVDALDYMHTLLKSAQ